MVGSDERGADPFSWSEAREHAWNYFELHATQRISMFNFFVVASGLIATGIGASTHASGLPSLTGVFLGGLLLLLSIVFWKIDQRTSFLIKHAEQALASIETAKLAQSGRLFANEPGASLGTRKGWGSMWTYGRALRVCFATAAAVGLSSMGLSLAQVAGVVGTSAGAKSASPTAQIGQGVAEETSTKSERP